VFGGHTLAETVLVHPLAITGIVSSLHDGTPNKDRSRRIYIHKPFIFKGMDPKATRCFRGVGCVGLRVFGMKVLALPFTAVLSSILTLAFAASGIRRGVLRQNFRVTKLEYPVFYRIRLGFHLARDFLA